jgi:Asp-tRNA(Asn)/Glu-tRNA(Gln) amidotransferase A subunit family amidase
VTVALFRLGLVEAIRRIRQGEMPVEEYTRSCLGRIGALDSGIEAWAFLDPERALAHARDADRRGTLSEDALPGIPVGVKDIIATRDMPTGMGSPVFAGSRPAENARVVQRLETAGGFVLGKTVTTELAFMHPGKTRNPWNAAHTPGGSSMGSAAAVAAGFVPAAIGTQTNGSVIRPAAFCGVVGYKPTRFAISFEGTQHFSRTLDQMGVFCRSVTDAAWFTAAIASIPGTIGREPLHTARPPRLALLADLPWARPDAEQTSVIERSCEAFARDGARVERFTLPETFDRAHLVHRTIMLYEAAKELGSLQESARARLSDKLNAALDEGRGIADGAYRGALADRDVLAFELAGLIQEFDAVICAPAPGAAPADLAQTGDPSFCTLWSLAGFPAIAIPAALSAGGVPLGLQLAAPAGSDGRLLGVAEWCEARLDFRQWVDRVG